MAEIVPLVKAPTIPEAGNIIRKLVEEGAISWTKHAKVRMHERDVTMPQIINCLLKGRVTQKPFYSHENGGGYETRVEKGTAGEWLRVAVCLKLNQTLLIVTVVN